MYQKQLESYGDQDDSDEMKKREILLLLEGKEQIAELTKEMVESLVTEIYVYDKGHVEIVFKYVDIMRNLQKILEIDIK